MSQRAGYFPLGKLLEVAARNSTELNRVRRLFDPKETLRVLPLDITYRELNGDPLPRRMRLWNTYGHLWIEAEHWDHDGGRFWREVVALAPIHEAAHLQIPCDLTPLQVKYTEKLRNTPSEDAQRQHSSFRIALHWGVEIELSNLAKKYPLGAWPVLTPDEMARPTCSKRGVTEIWIDGQDLAKTALQTAGPETLSPDQPGWAKALSRPRRMRSRELLRETLSGQAAALTYTLRATRDKGHVLEERFASHRYKHEIVWRYPFIAPSNRQSREGVFLPVDTVNTLLEDQLTWSHWSWVPPTELADIGTLCRGIHHSGEFSKIRDYLGANAPTAWHDAINAACEWDCFALIASCALHPARNLQISRRLRLGRVRTAYFRLFYNGGVLVGMLLKHSWAFGWACRPLHPVRCTENFRAVTGRELTDLPPLAATEPPK